MATAPAREVAPDERAPVGPPREPDSVAGARPPRAPRLLVAALLVVLVLPLAVALVAFHKPTWTPVLDLAQTELRVRDVGTRDTPLIGLPGRINVDGNQGSHPGPLSFYALAPAYRLLGGSAFALQVSTVLLHAGALLIALVIARRRGGTLLVLAVGAALALLVNGFGVTALTEPWNPYIPLFWWAVVLLAVWSVVEGDVVLLPVAVAAGSLCAQTHVPYLALCLGAGALAVVAAGVRFRRGDAATRRSILRWSGIALAVGVVLWIPPLVDEFRHDPGNLSILLRYFTHTPPGEPTVGLRGAVKIVLQRLDLFHLTVDQLAHPGLLVSVDPHRHVHELRGLVLALLWAGSAVAAIRMRHRRLLLLHLVVAVGLALVVIDVSHIYGTVWYYLLLSIWSVAALMAIATVWTAVVALRRTRPSLHFDRFERPATVFLAVVALAACARLTWVAPSADHSDPDVTAELRAVVPGTVQALDAGTGAADGKAGRYYLTWDDAAYIGSPGYGLLNELDRRGFDVGVTEGLRVIATPHRAMSESDATAHIALATGVWVDRWRAVPAAVEVAYFDPRTPEQRARFDQLRTDAIAELRASGLDDLVVNVDQNLFAAAIDRRIAPDTFAKLNEMLTLGVPIAVFIAPPGAHA